MARYLIKISGRAITVCDRSNLNEAGSMCETFTYD